MEALKKKIKSLPKEDKLKIREWIKSASAEERMTFADGLAKGNLDLTNILGAKNEMPKGLGISRAIIKNFSRNPESSLEYLTKKHPEYQFKLGDKGEILAKSKEDLVFSRLDPKGFDVRDISDIGYDVLSGIGETAAMGLAGIGGTLSTGLGGLPAAMAASGATAAGSETLRQGIGKLIGVNKDISPQEIAMTGALGTASPAIMRGIQKGVVPVIKGLSKIPSEAIDAYLKRKPALEKLFKKRLPEIGMDLSEQITETARETKNKLGQDVIEALNKGGRKIEIDELYDLINREIVNLSRDKEKKALGRVAIDQMDELLKLKRSVLGGRVNVSPTDAFKIQQNLKDYATFAQNPMASFSSIRPTKSVAQKNTAAIARAAYEKMNDIMNDATSGASKQAKNSYAQYMKITKNPAKIFQDPEKTIKALSTQGDPSRAYLKESIEMLDELTPKANLKEMGEDVLAYSYFKKPAKVQSFKSGGIMGMLTSSIPVAIGGAAGYGAGSILGEQTGPFSSIAPYIGAGLGAGVGASTFSPMMVKLMLDAINKTKTLPKAVTTFGPSAVGTGFGKQFIRDENYGMQEER